MNTQWQRCIRTLTFLSVGLWIASCGSDFDLDGRSTLPELPESLPSSETNNNDGDASKKDPDNSDLLADKNDDDTTQNDDTQTPDDTMAISRYFYWNWACDKSEFSEQNQTRPPLNPPTYGPQYKVALTDKERAKLSLYSTICPLSNYEYDIMFLVDVSRPMFERDRRSGGSCGRLRAIRNIIKTHRNNDGVRFALITFDDNIKYASKKFMTAKEFTNSNANTGRIVCSGADKARYNIAFDRAVEVFKEARTSSFSEAYLISDGRPESGFEGLEEAEALKNSNNRRITLATIQLGDETTQKLDALSSTMFGGSRFYAKANDLDALVDEAGNLSTPVFAGGFVYAKDPEYGNLETYPIKDVVGGQTFQIEMDNLTRESFPTGFRAIFDYHDNRGRNYNYSGTLIWE